MANLVVKKLQDSINDSSLKNLWITIINEEKSDWIPGTEFYIDSDDTLGLIGESYRISISANTPVGVTTRLRLAVYRATSDPASDFLNFDGQDLSTPLSGVVAITKRNPGDKAKLRVLISGNDLNISTLSFKLERIRRPADDA